MKYLTYSVPDVEHLGDVEYDKTCLRRMGATIEGDDIDWNEDEIESAYIYFRCEDRDLQKFLDYGAYEM